MTIHELQTLKQDIEKLIHDFKMSEIFKLMQPHDFFQGYQDFEHELMYDKPKGTDYKLFQERLLTFLHKQIASAIGKANALPALPQVSITPHKINTVDENEEHALFWFNRGNELQTDEDKILAYDKAIAYYQYFTKAYFKRGKVKAKLGKYQTAIEDFTQVILLNPKHKFAYRCRGEVKQDLQQYQEAIIDFKQDSKINPNNVDCYYRIAKCYSFLQDKENTLQNLKKLMQLVSVFKFIIPENKIFEWLWEDADFQALVA